MATIQSIEEEVVGKPIICIVGEKNALTEKLVEDNLSKFRVIFVSTKKIEANNANPDFYSITYKNSHVLPKLKETLDYSIIFLGSVKQREDILPVLEKINHDKTKTLILSNALQFKNNYDFFLSLKKYENYFFGLTGEVIDEKEESSENIAIVKKALSGVKVEISGNDNKSIFPIFIDDTVKNIYRLLFGSYKRDKLYFLFYKTPETLMSALRIIAHNNPDTKIIITDQRVEEQPYVSREELFAIASQNLVMQPVYMETGDTAFETSISKMLKEKIEEKKEESRESLAIPFFENLKGELNEKESSEKNNTSESKSIMSEAFLKKAEEKIRQKSYKKPINAHSFILKSVLLGILLFIALSVTFSFLSGLFYKKAIDNLMILDFSSMTESINASQDFSKFAKPQAFALFDLLNLLTKTGNLKRDSMQMEKNLSLMQRAAKTYKKYAGLKSLDKDSLETLISDVSYLYTEGEIIKLGDNNNSLFQFVNSENSRLLSLSVILNEMLGFDGSKNYLVLFQNSNELRPTGGSIGLAGLTTASSGTFSNIKFEDTYTLDGNLKEHIEPPLVVKRFLQPHLYLRDSNFDSSFPNSATIAERLYGLEKTKRAEYIVAINSTAIEEFLKATGPLKLDGINPEIDSRNYGTLLKITQETKNPNSIDNNLLEKLLVKFLTINQNNPKELFERLMVFGKLLDKKDLLIYSIEPEKQKIISANNYSGEVNVASDAKNLNDFLSVNEFNIGNTRNNSDISRSLNYKASIEESSITSTVDLTLDNKNTYSDYKVYLRFLVPPKSDLVSVKINGKDKQITEFESDPAVYEKEVIREDKLEFEESEGRDAKTFGMLARINPTSKNVISLSYKSGAAVPQDSSFLYSLNYFKQSGTSSFPFTYSLVDTKSHMVVTGKNILPTKTTTIDKDFKTSFEIQKR